MKKYMVYIDDGENCFKLAIPAKDEQDARKWADGSGRVIAVEDVTADYPIDLDKVAEALDAGRFGKIEKDFILRCLSACDIAR